jgi:hypothetical protein
VDSGTAGRLAAALWWLSVGMIVAAAVIDLQVFVSDDFAVVLTPVAVAFAAVGWLLAARRPGNPVGWLFAAWGAVMALMVFATAYVHRGLVRDPGSLPGADWVAWAAGVLWHPAFGLLVFLLLVFPHGRLLSRRWRPVAWLTVAAYGFCAVAAAWSPPVIQSYFPAARPVADLPGAVLAETVFWGVLVAAQVGLLGVAGTASLAVKLRRARGGERQQIKWFAYTVAVVVAALLAGIWAFGSGVLFPLFAAIPVAAAVAILRHRLYDIDRILNRTLVYGVLTAGLGLGYAGVVVALGSLVRANSSLVVAAATLAVAAAFQPARRRVQHAVDRRFNRRRFDAARTIQAFSHRLRGEIDLDALTTELLSVVDQTMEPTQASLWLRPSVGVRKRV